MGFDQAAVDEVDGEDISPSAVSTEEVNNTLFYPNNSDSTLQAAIGRAESNGIGIVFVEPGTYGEAIEIGSTNAIRLVGLTGSQSFSDNAVRIDATGIDDHAVTINEGTVENIQAAADGSFDCFHQQGDNNRFQILGCNPSGSPRDDCRVNGRRSVIERCEFVGLGSGNAITLTNNSSRIVIDSNVNLGTVEDNGSGNVIGDNS